MATATLTKPKRVRAAKKAAPTPEATAPVAPAAPEPQPAPIGQVLSNVHVDLGGFIAFDAAVRGAVMADDSAELNHLCVHDDDTVSKVEQRFTCPACSKLGKSEDFAKGKAKGDRFVVVPPEVVNASATADAEHKGKLTITVHDAAEVNHALAAGSVYYLAPTVKGTTNAHYATLAQVMAERPDLAFVGVMAMRKQAYRYLVSSDGKTITLTQLAHPDLVRQRPVAGVDASPDVVAGLHKLLDVIVKPFDARLRVTQRSTAISDFIEQAAGLPTVAATPDAPATSTDLNTALQAALAAAGVTTLDSKRKAS